LRIQEELVELAKTLPATEAGKELKYTLEELLEHQKRALAGDHPTDRANCSAPTKNCDDRRANQADDDETFVLATSFEVVWAGELFLHSLYQCTTIYHFVSGWLRETQQVCARGKMIYLT
jgi:hypothetical protein